MDYKISKYTYMFVSSKGVNLIYNSRTNSLCQVDNQLYSTLKQCKENDSIVETNKIASATFNILCSNKMLVRPEEDDDFLLKHQYETNVNTYYNSTLLLVLVPTTECNFACSYCFEKEKKAQIMSDNVIDALITFINSRQHVKDCGICWYGGEPLMGFEIMKKIMKRIKTEVKIPVKKHSIITNGSLINEEVIEFFREYKLDDIQITLDGVRKRHDTIRRDKVTHAPTYNRLIGNIDKLTEELPTVNISIRVNIEKENKDDYLYIRESLKKKWTGKKITIYPGFLRMDDETGKALSCTSFQKEEIADFKYELYQKGITRNAVFPHLTGEQCMAIRANAYVIGPKGEIYKCWNDVGNDSKIVGSIFTSKLVNPNLYYRYLVGTKWYNRKQCKDCFYLPICDNGCAWYILRNQYEHGHFVICNCMQKWNGMLEKSLEALYDCKMGKSSLSLKDV